MDEAPDSDPLKVLVRWHREATESGARDPDAMVLATASRVGRPSARVVLFKGMVGEEVQFVSHYTSRKGREIAENPEVALAFYWPELMRQIRIEGQAKTAPPADSDAYFRSRPRESQLGAWASAQSEEIVSRAELEERLRQAEARFSGREVERPSGWGMYRVRVHSLELWISAPHRLHDRFSYVRNDSGFSVVRLCP